MLQYELDQVKLQWKTHDIRRTRHDTIPGKPDQLLFLPESSGGKNQGTNINDSEIDSAYSEEESLMGDATVIMNDVDKELVEYLGKIKYTIINNKPFCFYFIFFHSLY